MVEFLLGLARANLAASAAVLAVVALRLPARRLFGARIAYALWLLPALAAAAVFIPARRIDAASIPATTMSLPDAAVLFDLPVLAVEASAPPGLDFWLLLAWAAGVAAALAVTIWSQRRFMLEAEVGRLGPAVVGVLSPRIIEPHDFAERFTAGEQRLVLAHEHAHLARQDARINALVVFLQCLNWFNPLIHLGAHLLRIDQELACDEQVITSFPRARAAYAQALLKAQLAIRPLPLGCYWPSGTQHPLFERISMINRHSFSSRRRMAGAAAIALLAGAAALGAWAAQPPRPQVGGEGEVCLTNACSKAANLRPASPQVHQAILAGDSARAYTLGGSPVDVAAALARQDPEEHDDLPAAIAAGARFDYVNAQGRLGFTVTPPEGSPPGPVKIIVPPQLEGLRPPADLEEMPRFPGWEDFGR